MGFGSGNPGDDNVQHGVNIQILDQALDSVGTGASYGTFRFYNYSLDIETIQNAELVTNGVYQYTYDVTVTNTGSVPTTDLIQPQAAPGTQLFIDPATVKVYLDPALTVKSTSVSAVVMPNAIKPAGSLVTWSVPQLDPGESVTLTVVANGPFDSGEHFIETVVQGNDGQVARGPWFERDSYQLFNFVFPIISN